MRKRPQVDKVDKCSRDFYQNLLVAQQIHSFQIEERRLPALSLTGYIRDCYSLSILFGLHHKQISMQVHMGGGYKLLWFEWVCEAI